MLFFAVFQNTSDEKVALTEFGVSAGNLTQRATSLIGGSREG